jgi:alpha-ketoglutarate-dependent taurine dioxygenase
MIGGEFMGAKKIIKRTEELSDVHAQLFDPSHDFFVVAEAKKPVDLKEWPIRNRAAVEALLLQHGAILLRNFGIKSTDLPDFLGTLLNKPLLDSYQGGVSPRKKVAKNVFLATLVPAQAGINQHHEMAYANSWPLYISFFCEKAAAHGGATPISNARHIIKELDPKIVQMFRERSILYIRNYREDTPREFCVTWQDAFETKDKAMVEKFLKENGFTFEWGKFERLKTMDRRLATNFHPVTGEEIFFNHSAVLNYYSGKKDVMAPALQSMAPCISQDLIERINSLSFDENPYCCAFADNGEPIDLSIQQEVAQVYNQCKVSFKWIDGDLLILDNMLSAHGRDPYIGSRTVLTVMSGTYSTYKTKK